MPPAARMTDPTTHGGTVVAGFPTVLIGNLPAARMGDPHICPMFTALVPHVGGVIIKASTTVKIGGAFAARQGDLCACPGAGAPGAGVPAVVGPANPVTVNKDGKTIDQLDKSNPNRALDAQAELTDTDQDGTPDTARAEAGAIRMRNQGAKKIGPGEIGGKHNLDAIYGRAQGTASTNNGGAGASGAAEVGMLKEGAEVSVGPAGDNGQNPYAAVGGEYDVLHAEAKGDALLGDDGKRVGIGAMGKAGAEVIGGKGTGKVTTPTLFGMNIQTKGEVSGSAGGVGGGLGGWVYYDRQERRLHVGALGKLVAGFGGELNLDISIGAAYGSGGGGGGAGAGAQPNPIAMGFPTVLIGG